MRKRVREHAQILSNKKVYPSYYLIRLRAPQIAARAKPGQFVNIAIDRPDIFFRRPFDFRKVNSSTIEILYKVIGKGTSWLSQKTNAQLDLIGPLGTGFDIKTSKKYSTQILLSGGIGIVPLLDVAEHLKAKQKRKIAFLGAREKKLIFCKKPLEKMGFQVKSIVDHTRKGKPVFMLNIFEEFLKQEKKAGNLENIIAYSVGPQPMIARTASLAKKYNIPIQISYEVLMGCGYGVCRGCNVRAHSGYKMVCQDGPVFDARDIDDDRF